jgi:hypothetical protein
MKVRIVTDQYYPFRCLVEVAEGLEVAEDIVSVDARVVRRWEETMKAFEKVQTEMARALEKEAKRHG